MPLSCIIFVTCSHFHKSQSNESNISIRSIPTQQSSIPSQHRSIPTQHPSIPSQQRILKFLNISSPSEMSHPSSRWKNHVFVVRMAAFRAPPLERHPTHRMLNPAQHLSLLVSQSLSCTGKKNRKKSQTTSTDLYINIPRGLAMPVPLKTQ